ncbi:hypothetical protein C5167_030215 [Papaver somniferum]|nr:hypothetical protein C5167_030215 [Papaver somniferum]
MKNQAINTSRS